MATVYSINYTDTNEPGFIINPNQIDGSTGSNSNSSLILHGTGRLKYGEALNENLLHLLENFASPERAMPLVSAIQNADNNGSVGTHFVSYFGDTTSDFISGFIFDIGGSTGSINDGTYTTVSSSYDQPSNLTTVIIVEAFPDDQAATLGNVEYTIVEPDPSMLFPPYTIGQLWFNKTDDKLYIYRNVSNTATDIFQWILVGSGSAFESTPEEPLLPTDGMLWYDTVTDQLMVYNAGTFDSVADRYVLKAGDTISSESGLIGSVGHTDGVLRFTNAAGTNGTLYLNEGQGQISDAPDIRADSAMSQSSGTRFGINFDGDNTGTDDFFITKGSHLGGSQTALLSVENDGTLHVFTAAYEALLTNDNDIPNKKFVDDAITDLTNLVTSNYVLITGDTMTGALQLNNNSITLGSGDSTIHGEGNFGLFVDTTPSLDAGGILIKTGDNNGDEHAIELLNYLGERKYSLRATTGNQEIYGTTQYTTGAHLFLDHPPTGTLEAATKGYVDALNGTGGGNLVHANPTVPVNGDIKVTGSGASLEIFIWGNSTWNKIFPAQYTP